MEFLAQGDDRQLTQAATRLAGGAFRKVWDSSADAAHDRLQLRRRDPRADPRLIRRPCEGSSRAPGCGWARSRPLREGGFTTGCRTPRTATSCRQWRSNCRRRPMSCCRRHTSCGPRRPATSRVGRRSIGRSVSDRSLPRTPLGRFDPAQDPAELVRSGTRCRRETLPRTGRCPGEDLRLRAVPSALPSRRGGVKVVSRRAVRAIWETGHPEDTSRGRTAIRAP